jgi:hypothetical protein
VLVQTYTTENVKFLISSRLVINVSKVTTKIPLYWGIFLLYK